jgi:hypothetical protein
MSISKSQLLEQARTACKRCFSRQLFLLKDAERLSSTIKARNTMLYLQLKRLSDLDPFPEVTADQSAEIASISAVSQEASSEEDLSTLQERLLAEFAKIGDTEIDERSVDTKEQLNKRMLDLMHLMKDKIRATRRRLNDAGGGYDEEAYKSVRNQLYLSQHLYIEQLENDIVMAPHEDCAKIEQVHYPDILAAETGNFIERLTALLEFLKARILDLNI